MATILVVDDDPDVLVIVEQTLKGSGHRVLTCSKPTAVAELAADNSVDAVVLDIRMPELSGYDVLRELRDQPRTGGVPILFLSALGDSKDRIRGLREGADDFLTKPFAPEELTLRVDRLVGQRSRGDSGGHESLSSKLDRGLSDQRVVGQVFLGRYKALEVVGEGAMGVVFRGWDPLLKRPVALKTLRIDRFLSDSDRRSMMSQLLQEAVTVARFSHPNIVAVFDMVDDPETAFIAMEYVDGTSLADYLEKRGKLPPEQVVLLALGVARALAAAHEHRIVHHDVKPGNVLLGVDGSIKVTDFGVAQLVTSLAASRDRIFGTPGYLPPETLLNQGYSETGDLFGLGAILYQCLTGERAFAGDSVHQRMVATVSDPVIPPRVHEPEICAELNDLVLALLAKEPEARIQRAREVVTRLAGMQREGVEWEIALADKKSAERSSGPHSMLISPADLSELSES